MSALTDRLLEHLGHPVAKWLLAGTAAAAFGPAGGFATLAASGLYDATRALLTDRRQAKEAGRNLEDLADRVVEDVPTALEGEGVSAEALAAAAAELATTLGTEDVLELALAADLEAAKLGDALLAARPPEKIWRDEQAPQTLYRRLVAALAPALLAVLRELPRYEPGRDAELLSRLSELKERAGDILDAARKAAADGASTRMILEERDKREQAARSRDEEAYRTALFEQVRWLRLFGLDAPDIAPDLPLDLAYVPLRLELAGQERGLRLAFPEVLALLPAFGNRLLIEAPAGFGKTTLLQWLTRTSLHADERTSFPDAEAVLDRLEGPRRGPDLDHWPLRAHDEEDPLRAHFRRLREALPADAVPWHERLPAFLRLRDLRDDPLWPIAEWPQRIAPQAGIETRDWWLAAVEEGRAILLLDGVDEVPPDRRGRLREAIEALMRAHPQAMVVVTSRPGAVRAARWNTLFADARLSIEPMGPSDIESFVGHWHAALRQIAPGRAPSEEEEHRLLRRILDRPGLRNLAQVPLLCAAICWLARIRRGELPDRMADLFDRLADQLVHRLDAERLGREGLARLVPVLDGLDSTHRIGLLARLAWFGVRERQATLERTTAERQLTASLRDLGKAEGREVPRLLDALLERSGILRPAGENAVEFVHNALRGFLAATRFADEGAVQDPVRAAPELDDWDLPVLAAARGTRGYRENLIRALLDRAGHSRADPATARRLRIAALRCAETGGITPDLREELRTLERELLPPRDAREAAWFAELGPRIVPHLGARDGLDDETAAACVRCLALIGGEEARAQLDSWNAVDNPGLALLRALLDACENPLDVQGLRNLVVNPEPDFFDWDPPQKCLEDSHLTRLVNFGPIQHLDLSFTRITNDGLRHLVGLTRLTSLELIRTRITGAGLEHLAELTNLERLDLTGTAVGNGGTKYLMRLAKLQFLNLSLTSVTDAGIKCLAKLTDLQELVLSHTAVGDDGLEHLAGLPKLERLHLFGANVTHAGIARFRDLRREAGLPEVEIVR